MTYLKPIIDFVTDFKDTADDNGELSMIDSVVATDAPQAILQMAMEKFGADIALASSFSMEDVVCIDMMMEINPRARIFALDTGRLNEETYACAEKIRHKYDCNIEWFFPENDSVQELIRSKGLYSFKESIEERRQCCFIRKVEPLKRALSGLHAWVTGQRREQSNTRSNLQIVEIDAMHNNIAKINPLTFWTAQQVRDYVELRHIPYNTLYDQGYQSIGCSPCTRASALGEDERSGRWWWESAEHKECGLHLTNYAPPA
ncbi:phosphoadenylyl-sulfate reductase [soil metagenome]